MYDRYIGLDGKTHRASVLLDRDTPQARKKAHKELLELIQDKCVIGADTPFYRLIEQYLEHKDVKPSTLANYDNAFKQVKKLIGDVPISHLSSPFILRKLSESGKSQKTVNRYIILLNNLFDWSYQYGYMSEQIKIRTEKLKEKKRNPEMEYLEVQELRDVLDQLQGRMPYYVCKFLALTGCRIGEASALTWEDIDDRYVHITKAYKYENGISTPKTLSSIRDIYIQPELRVFLNEYRQWRNLYLMAHGIRTELLFFSRSGMYYPEHTLLSVLRTLKSDKHLHPHIFRHTHVALLAEQGMSLEAIARRLGHSDSKVTKDIYFHVTEKLKERDELALDKVQIL